MFFKDQQKCVFLVQIVWWKWLCTVVEYAADDGFVVTAYLTDQLKPGERLWPKK